MNPKGLWRDPRSGVFYLRRRIPLPLQSAFACGQLDKVSLGTADQRDAERKLAIANGEYEQSANNFARRSQTESRDHSPSMRHASWSTASAPHDPLPGLRLRRRIGGSTDSLPMRWRTRCVRRKSANKLLCSPRPGVDRTSPQSNKKSRCGSSSPKARFPGALPRTCTTTLWHAAWCSCRLSCARSRVPDPLFSPQARRRAMRFEIGRADHEIMIVLRSGACGVAMPSITRMNMRYRSTASSNCRASLRQAQGRLCRAIFSRRIASPQPIVGVLGR